MRRSLSIFVLAVWVAMGAHAATLRWGCNVLLDTQSGYGYAYGGNLYANPGVDLYLIYNGVGGSFPGAWYDADSGALAYIGSDTAIPFEDTYTTTMADFNAGNFSVDLTGVGLTTWNPNASTWEEMNNYSFTILAIVDTDGGDYSSGAWYGVYTATPVGFTTATGNQGVGGMDAGDFDASGSGHLPPYVLTPNHRIYVESEYGDPSPGRGENDYYETTSVVYSVASPVAAGGTNFTCGGWTGTGIVPATGSSNSVGLTINPYTSPWESSLTWNWTAVEYGLDVTVNGSGSLNVGNGWQAVGTNLNLVATADPGWLFMGWSGDVTGDYAQTNTSLLMDAPKSIAATFSEDADEDGLTNAAEASLGTDPRIADSDHDAMEDGAEWIAGTDPTNSASCFQIMNAAPSAEGFVVGWDAVSGRVYTVYWMDSLFNEPSMLTNDIPFPHGSYTDTVHSVESEGYYILQVELE